MYKPALILSLNLLFVSAAWSGTPKPDKWLVTQLSGDARVVHPGFHAASLKVNEEIAPGDTLLTGPTGRATLIHGATTSWSLRIVKCGSRRVFSQTASPA